MKSLYAGILSKFTGSQVSTDVGGRIYLDRAPDSATFPYIVFSLVSGMQNDTFTDKIDEYLIQFSIYSVASGYNEIGTAYADLISLFDDASFSISGDTLLKCQRENVVTMMVDDIVSTTGTKWCRLLAVDYRMVVKD